MTTTLDSRTRGPLARFLRSREIPVASALVVLVVVTTLINPQFLSPQGVKDLLLTPPS